jgi:hypothetical protein
VHAACLFIAQLLSVTRIILLSLPTATSLLELTSRNFVPLEELLVIQLVEDLGKNYHYYASTAFF